MVKELTKKMKDSGVEWIGEIPEDWEVQNLKSILEERNEMNNPIKTESILSLTNDRGVIPYSEKGDIGNKSKEDLTKYKLVYPNDIVVNSMNVIIGSVGLSDYFGATSPVYYMLYPRNYKDSVKYYTYLFQTKEFQSKLVGYGNGIMEHRMRIPMMNLNKVHLPYPDSLEQKSIADFLDEKTQEIDNIISKTKKAIEEYKKYKQSLITETVTKGLDKNVQMKDSEIEWIGKIPEHWDATKLKNVTSKLTDGAHISPDTNEGKYYFVSTVDINNGMIDFNNALKTSKESYEYMVRTGCKPNIEDLLMSKDGTIGKMALVREENNFVVASSLLIISSNTNSIIEYIYYYLMSKVGENQIESYHKGSGLRRISIINTGNILITVPPLQEQKAIASYLDQKCSQIDQIISTKEKLLTEMEAYKKSLIYETVTGKREVE